MSAAGSVWLTFAEVVPDGSGGEWPAGAEGAYVTCYGPAESIEVAISDARAALVADGFRVIDITECSRFDPDDWDSKSEDLAVARERVRAAREAGGVVYGLFGAYPPEGDDGSDPG